MVTFNLATTALGLPVTAHRFEGSKSKTNEILILGGVHGDELEGVTLAQKILSDLMNINSYTLNITVVPEFNIEGILLKQRMNSRGVDLNRNLPTKDWSPVAATERYHPGPSPLSESENQGLVKLIEKFPPRLILSLHSWNPMINVNGPCTEEAKILARATGYPIEKDIGYPTPGSLGTYAGLERQIPTITYEIQRDLPLPEVIKIHSPALHELLHHCEVTYVS